MSFLRMQHYAVYLTGFNFSIIYRPTNKHSNADALSRLPFGNDHFRKEDSTEKFIINQLQEVPLRIQDIARETLKCPELSQLLKILKGSVPLREETKHFGIDLGEFGLHEDSIILRGHRVVIPRNCRKFVLAELHEGHFGAKKMKELARRHVWWKQIDKDINDITLQCKPCLLHGKNPPREILHNWKPTTVPFERIHLDYAGPVQGKLILLLVDAHSKWLEAFITPNKTSSTTLSHLKECIARFGLPSVIVTDNDPCFVSHEFETFCRVNGIRHKTSPPFHPSSNGQIERYVGTMKTALKKLSEEGRDFQTNLSLFLYRQRMSVCATGETPAFRMLGRELRSKLDMLLDPQIRKPWIVKTPDQPNSPKYHRPSMKFSVGETVMVRDYRNPKRAWVLGKIVRLMGSRVCLVKVGKRKMWKRHIEQLRRCSIEVYDTEEDQDERILLDFDDTLPLPKNGKPEEKSATQTPAPQLTTESPETIGIDREESNFPKDNVNTETSSDQHCEKAKVRRSERRNIGKPPERYGESNCSQVS